jgi:hypothetical protein
MPIPDAEARVADRADKGLPTLVTELWALVRDYAKQETVDPLKRLGRFIGFGLPGALLTGIGVVLLMLAGLRALQTETGEHLTGSWSWVPYAAMLVVTAAVAGLSARAVTSTKRKAAKKGSVA